MARVDFYLCQDGDQERAMDVTCRLCEKAFRAGLGIHIQCADADQARTMDELLWSYAPASFLPHTLLEASNRIEVNALPTRSCTLVVNLTNGWLAEPEKYERVAEVVDAGDASVSGARERYKQYRSLGWQLNNHKV